MAIVNLNFAEIAHTAFTNILGSPGVVKEGVVYKYNEAGEEVATDTPEQTIKDEMDKILSETLYKNERKNLYPDLEEQLDKLFHDIDQGKLDKTGEFYTALKTIKDAFPKDGSKNSSLEKEE